MYYTEQPNLEGCISVIMIKIWGHQDSISSSIFFNIKHQGKINFR